LKYLPGAHQRRGAGGARVAGHGKVERSQRQDGELIKEDVEKMPLLRFPPVERPQPDRAAQDLPEKRRDLDDPAGVRQPAAQRSVEIERELLQLLCDDRVVVSGRVGDPGRDGRSDLEPIAATDVDHHPLGLLALRRIRGEGQRQRRSFRQL